MKKYLILLFLSITAIGFAQDNVVKLNVMGVSYGDFSLTYERKIAPQSSLNLTVGLLNPNYSLFAGSASGDVDEVGLCELYKGFHTSLDYRFYVGKHEATKGFYLGPYLRYADYKFMLIDEIDQDYFNVDAKISTIGLGFQMGYHWVVFDKVSIDWYFFGVGIEYAMAKGVYTYEDSDYDYSTITDNVKDVFDGWNYFQKNLKTTVNKENMTAKLSSILPGIKTGITIGYAF